ncbi:hypothetical protein [Streptomyces sp. NPDC018055]|uniref:hypothetical protein n=1 Tax=Streptomyces sp. NPDC018055 TaxID=3365038 RepID=UPI00379DFBF9
MTQPEPTLGQLWQLIERDSQRTRDHVQTTLDDVKRRLDGFMTKELWQSEKSVLEQRISRAEEELQAQQALHNALKDKLEREARQDARARSNSAREFVYKGIIPVLALLIAGLGLYIGTR